MVPEARYEKVEIFPDGDVVKRLFDQTDPLGKPVLFSKRVGRDERKMMIMPELRPCPFCGSQPKLRDSAVDYALYCPNFKCVGPQTWYRMTLDQACEDWNTRNGDQESERLNVELAEARADNAAILKALKHLRTQEANGYLSCCGMKSNRIALDVALQPHHGESLLAELAAKNAEIAKLRKDDESCDTCDLLKQHLAEANTELAKLREIVGKLPRTADGVPVVPGMLVYTMTKEGSVQLRIDDDLDARLSFSDYDDTPLCECYSTRAAAEAAKGGVR